MNDVIDVNYDTEIAIEAKSTEQLTIEANIQYRQAESLASMSMSALAEVGRRLLEIKNRIQHGEFEEWCADNLIFSKRQAEQYMKLAAKIDDENSFFSKTQTFADIGISRVWALLAAPEEVAEEVVENNDVADMTVRELKEEIKRIKAEKDAAEARADAAEMSLSAPAEQDLEDMRLSVEHMKEALDKKEEERAAAASAQQKAADQLAKTKDKLKALKDKQQEELDKAIAERAEQLKAEARAEADKKLTDYEEDIKEYEEEVERLTKKLQNAESEDFARFRVQAKNLQNAFNDCLGAIDAVSASNPSGAESMKAALIKVLDMEMAALKEGEEA